MEVQQGKVAAALQKLNLGKIAGSDGISAELLKGGGSIITDLLLELTEEVWRTKVVPQHWKDTELVPLYKKGDRMKCDNYHGISPLSVPGKVFSLLLLEHLKKICWEIEIYGHCSLFAKVYKKGAISHYQAARR